MSPSCDCQVFVMSPSCDCQVLSCHHHVTVGCLSCHHHLTVRCLSCHHYVTVRYLSCHHHVTVRCWLNGVVPFQVQERMEEISELKEEARSKVFEPGYVCTYVSGKWL